MPWSDWKKFGSVTRGSINIPNANEVVINLGFKPKMLFATQGFTGSAKMTMFYDETLGTITMAIISSSTASANVNNTNTSKLLKITDNGFSISGINANYFGTWEYWAI